MGKNSSTGYGIAGIILGALIFGWGFFVISAVPTNAQGVGAQQLKYIYELGKGKEPKTNGPECAGENATKPICNPQCWQKDACIAFIGLSGNPSIWEQDSSTVQVCGPKKDGWGFCYPAPVDVKLQVPLGNLKTAGNAADYIRAMYVFFLGIVGLVAVIVFIHAGFLYLTAGGNASSIARAKEYILNASLGMLLVFGSYTFLSIINPDLVRLKVPRAYLLRHQALALDSAKDMEGQFCDTEKDAAACKASCQGCSCVAIRESGMSVLGKYVAWASASAFGGATLGTAGGTALLKGSWFATKSVGKLLFNIHRLVGATLGAKANAMLLLSEVLAVDAAASNMESWLATNHGLPFGGERLGLCISDPKRNVPIGGQCVDDINCVQKPNVTCMKTDWMPSPGGFGFQIGICSDGTEGSACNNDGDCTGNNGCEEGPDNSKWCAPTENRKLGSPCDTGDCNSEEPNCKKVAQCGPGLRCRIVEKDFKASIPFTDTTGLGWCMDGSADVGAGGLSACITKEDCNPLADGTELQCLVGTLSGEEGGRLSKICTQNCKDDDQCKPLCPEGKTCVCRENASSRKVCTVPNTLLGNGFVGCQSGAAACDPKLNLHCSSKTLPATFDLRVCTDKKRTSPCTSNIDCEGSLVCGLSVVPHVESFVGIKKHIRKNVVGGTCVDAAQVVACSDDSVCRVLAQNNEVKCSEKKVDAWHSRICVTGTEGDFCSADSDCAGDLSCLEAPSVGETITYRCG